MCFSPPVVVSCGWWVEEGECAIRGACLEEEEGEEEFAAEIPDPLL